MTKADAVREVDRTTPGLTPAEVAVEIQRRFNFSMDVGNIVVTRTKDWLKAHCPPGPPANSREAIATVLSTNLPNGSGVIAEMVRCRYNFPVTAEEVREIRTEARIAANPQPSARSQRPMPAAEQRTDPNRKSPSVDTVSYKLHGFFKAVETIGGLEKLQKLIDWFHAFPS
jgi:hypothetical protein